MSHHHMTKFWPWNLGTVSGTLIAAARAEAKRSCRCALWIKFWLAWSGCISTVSKGLSQALYDIDMIDHEFLAKENGLTMTHLRLSCYWFSALGSFGVNVCPFSGLIKWNYSCLDDGATPVKDKHIYRNRLLLLAGNNALRYQDRNIQRHPNTGVYGCVNVLEDCLPIFTLDSDFQAKTRCGEKMWRVYSRNQDPYENRVPLPDFNNWRLVLMNIHASRPWTGEDGRRSFCGDFWILRWKKHCGKRGKRKNGRVRYHELRTVRIYKYHQLYIHASMSIHKD